jgi:DNA mismatch repair protein MSH4
MFLAIAAAFALLKYVEMKRGCIFAPKTLKITVQQLDGFMQIDSTSARNLELIQASRTSKERGKIDSLFAALNFTKTSMGSNLNLPSRSDFRPEKKLRASLLQPFNDIETLNQRYDALQELIDREDAFLAVSNALDGFPDIDSICNSLGKSLYKFYSKFPKLLLPNSTLRRAYVKL